MGGAKAVSECIPWEASVTCLLLRVIIPNGVDILV